MSSTLDWITPCQRYALQITAEAWQQIDQECRRSGSVETGGILIGCYTTDASTAIVTEAQPPSKDSAWGRSWFHRGVAGLRGLLARRWESEPRTYYIGEWHYHPASFVEPSEDDLSQMHAIGADRRFHCEEPIMIIAGNVAQRGELRVRAYVFPQGGPFIEFIRSDRLGMALADPD